MKRSDDPQAVAWSKAIFKRDGYKCVACGRKSRKWLNAHHLDGWNWFIAGRYEIRNGVTLCSFKGGCHDTFHNIYGRGNNTQYQFDDYLRSYHRKTLSEIKR
jgi:predicted restriction endonuclease